MVGFYALCIPFTAVDAEVVAVSEDAYVAEAALIERQLPKYASAYRGCSPVFQLHMWPPHQLL